MRVYLTGHRTFGNRGCEAIVRSTVTSLRAVGGDDSIFLVPSCDIARDSRQWPEAENWGVEFVPAYNPWQNRYWVHTQRLPVPWLKRAGWPFPLPRWFHRHLAAVDAVLAIGGDNYSLDYRLPSLLQGMDSLAMDMGKPVVLWGASVGPFEREPHYVPAIRRHLARMKQIMVRESVSYDYLVNTLSLDNVKQIVDPAFGLLPQDTFCTHFWPKDGGSGIIGVNVSPLIERYKKPGQNLAKEVAAFIGKAVRELGFGVLLVPHVVPLNGKGKNNDAAYMAQILRHCAALHPYVKLVPGNLNAAELKHVISRLRFFIGARTHATIAALSSSIPTVSIAYSIKARGINRDLFGHEDMVLPLPTVSVDTLYASLRYLVENETAVRYILDARMKEYQKTIAAAAADLTMLVQNSVMGTP